MIFSATKLLSQLPCNSSTGCTHNQGTRGCRQWSSFLVPPNKDENQQNVNILRRRNSVKKCHGYIYVRALIKQTLPHLAGEVWAGRSCRRSSLQSCLWGTSWWGRWWSRWWWRRRRGSSRAGGRGGGWAFLGRRGLAQQSRWGKLWEQINCEVLQGLL